MISVLPLEALPAVRDNRGDAAKKQRKAHDDGGEFARVFGRALEEVRRRKNEKC